MDFFQLCDQSSEEEIFKVSCFIFRDHLSLAKTWIHKTQALKAVISWFPCANRDANVPRQGSSVQTFFISHYFPYEPRPPRMHGKSLMYIWS